MPQMIRWSLALALLLLAGCQDALVAPEVSLGKKPPSPPPPLPPGAQIIDLSMNGAYLGQARTISPNGWILGAPPGPGTSAYRWEPVGDPQAIKFTELVGAGSIQWSSGNTFGDVTGVGNIGPHIRRAIDQYQAPIALTTGPGNPGNWIARDVNDAGIAVGMGYPGYGISQPVVWPTPTTYFFADLPAYPLGLATWTQEMTAINNGNRIAGRVTERTGNNGSPNRYRAFIWQLVGGSSATIERELPTAPGASDHWAVNINDADVVVGFIYRNQHSYPIRWSPSRNSDGTIQDYAVTVPDLTTFSNVYLGLNACGVMAGGANFGSEQRAFVWDGTNVPVSLPGLPGSTSSRATAINDDGDVVGVSSFAGQGKVPSTSRPTLWRGFTPPCPSS